MKVFAVAVLLMVVVASYSLPQGYDYQAPKAPKTPQQSYQAPQQTYLAPQPSNRIENVVMEGMPYDFNYNVNDPESGNTFSHVENSDGQRTQGEYRVLLPDGRTQVVSFFDNGGGFNADVQYEK